MVARIVWNIGAGLVHRALNKSRMRPGMGFDYPAVWRARPGFLDCDINLHLNNAAYLFNMELARWHFSASTGVLFEALRHGRVFLIGSQTIRYRHPIPPFRPYEIRTRVAHWDSEWIYFLHHFQCPTTGKVYAEGLCRATVRQGKRNREIVSGAQLLAEVNGGRAPHAPPAEMPDVVKQFLDWDAACKTSMEAAAAEAKTTAAATAATTSQPPRGLYERLTRSMNLPF